MLKRPALQLARYIVLDEFLVSQETRSLLEFVRSHESKFRVSEVVLPTSERYEVHASHRRSRVLLSAGPFHTLITDRIKFYFSHIQEALHHPPFDISKIEVQITASNDRDFFRTHNDREDAYLPSREISYVYFFHQEPKRYTGGELRIYDWQWKNGKRLPAETFATIVPRQNQIVFFLSSCPHEVRTVRCPSRAFMHSRFTLNGWIHQ